MWVSVWWVGVCVHVCGCDMPHSQPNMAPLTSAGPVSFGNHSIVAGAAQQRTFVTMETGTARHEQCTMPSPGVAAIRTGPRITRWMDTSRIGASWGEGHTVIRPQ